MDRERVVVYFGKLGGRLQEHQRVMLMKDAETIARLLSCDFEGEYSAGRSFDGCTFYVPDDSLLPDEASLLGIRSPERFYGGMVPFPFVKTKVITHGLLDSSSVHPMGWSFVFSERVREVVFSGYTAFSHEDARRAAAHLLSQGPVRIKSPLGASGKGQMVVRNLAEVNQLWESWDAHQLKEHGLVLEEDIQNARTFSVGLVTLRDMTVAYCGMQRMTKDNNGHSIYGGSTLMCVRGDWDALENLRLTRSLRLAVRQAKIYDQAMEEYRGFIASRRNYDVGQGKDYRGNWKSGVFESSWRVGGATAAELLAIKSFLEDPSLKTIRVCHREEYGADNSAPDGSIIHFQGNDPVAGPVIRYTIAESVLRRGAGRVSAQSGA